MCFEKFHQDHSAYKEDHDDEDSIDDKNNIDSETERIMNEKHKLDSINTMSKFFYEQDIDKELKEDFDDEILEDISSDEFQEDTEHLLVENHREITETHTKNLQQEMQFLIQSFDKMSGSMNSNLSMLKEYIKNLQENQNQSKPEMQKMVKVVSDLREELFEQAIAAQEMLNEDDDDGDEDEEEDSGTASSFEETEES